MCQRNSSSNTRCARGRGNVATLQRLQEQDRRNHEAYIRSDEINEDRQQAYEKVTNGYEKLLASTHS